MRSIGKYVAFMAAVVLLAFMPGRKPRRAVDMDWSEQVEGLLAGYSAEFSLEGPQTDEDSDRVIYTATTKDANAISFTIICRFARPSSPVGGTLPFKERQVTDDFYEKVVEKMSGQYGKADLTGLSADQAAAYMMGVIAKAQRLAETYNILYVQSYGPYIQFNLTNGERSYSAKLGPKDEGRFSHILRAKLGMN